MTPNELFEQYQGLVPYIYQKRFSQNPTYHSWREDIEQEGLIGLWNACRTYKEGSETAFATYAYTCIYRRMLSYAERTIYPQSSHSISLEVVISEDSDGNQLRISECITDPESVDGKLTVEDIMSKILSESPPMLCKIVKLALSGYSQEYIAEHLGIAQCTVSRGWRKFQKEFKNHYIGGSK